MKRLSQSEERVRVEYLLRGMKVVKIVSPNFFVYDSDTKESKFVIVKRVGERLSTAQQHSVKELKKGGFKVEVAIVNLDGKVMRLDTDWGKISIPSKRMFKEPDLNMVLDEAKPTKFTPTSTQIDRGVIYDPDKHRLTPEQRAEMDRQEKIQQKKEQELLNIFGVGVDEDEK